MTPLHLAAMEYKGSAEVVSTLVQAGANVNALNSDQESPLHVASLWNPVAVPILVGAGCKVNLLNDWGTSPLFLVAFFSGQDRSAVAALMSAGADPYLGKSPLTHHVVSDEIKDYIRSLSK